MKNIIIFVNVIALLVLLSSCSTTTSNTTTDSSGNVYRLVSAAKGDQVEIWEKIKPLDTNSWYTPTLASLIYTNLPKEFNPLMR